jgi:hypothetical protein
VKIQKFKLTLQETGAHSLVDIYSSVLMNIIQNIFISTLNQRIEVGTDEYNGGPV